MLFLLPFAGPVGSTKKQFVEPGCVWRPFSVLPGVCGHTEPFLHFRHSGPHHSLSDMSDNWLPHYCSCCFSVDQVSNTLQCGSTKDCWPTCGAGSGQVGAQEPRVGGSLPQHSPGLLLRLQPSPRILLARKLSAPLMHPLVPHPHSLAMCRPDGDGIYEGFS